MRKLLTLTKSENPASLWQPACLLLLQASHSNLAPCADGFRMSLTSGPVNNIILRDEGRDLAVLCALVAGLLLGCLLLALLAGLLGRAAAGARAAVVVVLVLAVFALGVVLCSALQGAAAPRPRALALTAFTVLPAGLAARLPLVPVPVSVAVPLFLPLLLFVGRHDPPRAFLSPLTAGPP